MQNLRIAHVPAFDTPSTPCRPTCTCTSTRAALRRSTRRRPISCRRLEPDRDLVKRIFGEVRAPGKGCPDRDRDESGPARLRHPGDRHRRRRLGGQREGGSGHRPPHGSQDPQSRRGRQGGGGRHRSRRPLLGRGGQAVRQDHRRVAEVLPEANLQGVTLHPMSRRGVDVTVGSWRDATFGPTLFAHPRVRRRAAARAGRRRVSAHQPGPGAVADRRDRSPEAPAAQGRAGTGRRRHVRACW